MLIVGLSFWLASTWLKTPVERWFFPSLALSTLAIGACAIGWRPFYWRYTRVVLLFALLVPCFAWFTYSIAYAFIQEQDIRYRVLSLTGSQWLGWGIPMLITFAYSVSAWLALRSVRLARCNVTGKIPETSWRANSLARSAVERSNEASRAEAVPDSFPPAVLRSSIRGILVYEISLLRNLNATKFILGAYVLVLLFAALVDRAEIQGLIVLSVLLWMTGGLLTEVIYTQLEQGRLPSLLASAPISSRTLVWTRQAFVTGLVCLGLLGLPVILLIWNLTGASEAMVQSIQSTLTFATGQETPLWKASLAIAAIATALVARQSTWSVAMISMRNRRVGLYWFATKFLLVTVAIGIFVYRFLKFPSWEAWNAWASEQTGAFLFLLYWLAGIKLLVASLSAMQLRGSSLASSKAITTVFVIFALGVAAVTLAGWNGLPFSQVGLSHWICFAVAIVPLTRVLIAPILLNQNRHGA